MSRNNLGNGALRAHTDAGGITFQNLSDVPITITSLSFSPSFQAVNTSSPITMRLFDSLKWVGAYSAEGMIAEQNIGNGISSVSFDNLSYSIPANGQRLLAVGLLGVNFENMAATSNGKHLNPTIALTVSGATTNPSNAGIETGLTLQWTCSLDILGVGYDVPWGPPIDAGSSCFDLYQ